ncbi:MAG: hypothetical protein Roseis2KO_21010 [Roseivirga sp.]
MNCHECDAPNQDNATFCRSCGTRLGTGSSAAATRSPHDRFLLFFILITVVLNLVQFGIDQIFENWYESPVKYVKVAIWILQNLSFILIPLAIKNKSYQLISLIVIIPTILYWTYTNLMILAT